MTKGIGSNLLVQQLEPIRGHSLQRLVCCHFACPQNGLGLWPQSLHRLPCPPLRIRDRLLQLKNQQSVIVPWQVRDEWKQKQCYQAALLVSFGYSLEVALMSLKEWLSSVFLESPVLKLVKRVPVKMVLTLALSGSSAFPLLHCRTQSSDKAKLWAFLRRQPDQGFSRSQFVLSLR